MILLFRGDEMKDRNKALRIVALLLALAMIVPMIMVFFIR